LELTNVIFDYIEVFYNRQRRHSSLDYVSPVEFKLNKLSMECKRSIVLRSLPQLQFENLAINFSKLNGDSTLKRVRV